MKTKYALTVALVALVLAATASESHGLLTRSFRSTVINQANVDVSISILGVRILSPGGLVSVVANTVGTVVYSVLTLLGQLLSLPFTITAIVDGVVRSLTIPIQVGATILIRSDLGVLVNGVLAGFLT